jgi:hypothetical protein
MRSFDKRRHPEPAKLKMFTAIPSAIKDKINLLTAIIGGQSHIWHVYLRQWMGGWFSPIFVKITENV